MFTEYTREEIENYNRSSLTAESKSTADKTAPDLNESTEAKDDEVVADDLNSSVLYDMEGESLW